ncbi:MAG: aminotransferase class I/II-fold pyridoxal phosphate-dependent enzyme [Candidatus Micrarchaeia archaeon]
MLISKRSRYARNPIEEEDALASILAEKGRKIIKLNRGDPPVYFPTPEYIIKAYIAALREKRTTYTSAFGIEELRSAVSKRYKSMYNIDSGSDDVIVVQGVTEALKFINSALIDESDNAVIFKPYYPLYLPDLLIYGGKPVFGKYEEEKEWSIDIDRLESALRRTAKKPKYMLITNPNNPTGSVLGRSTLERIVEIANEYDIVLISDEIYDEIVYNGAKFTSIGQVAKGMPHVILNGASKDFDATGFRLGFMLIPGDDSVSKTLKSTFARYAQARLSPNAPAQYALAEGINNAREHQRSIKRMVGEIEKRVNLTTKIINESEYMSAVNPKGAFYVFPKVNLDMLKIKNDKEFVDKLLYEERVQLTRGSGFGEQGHIRIVALPPKNILEYALNKINDFCRRNSKEA